MRHECCYHNHAGASSTSARTAAIAIGFVFATSKSGTPTATDFSLTAVGRGFDTVASKVSHFW